MSRLIKLTINYVLSFVLCAFSCTSLLADDPDWDLVDAEIRAVANDPTDAKIVAFQRKFIMEYTKSMVQGLARSHVMLNMGEEDAKEILSVYRTINIIYSSYAKALDLLESSVAKPTLDFYDIIECYSSLAKWESILFFNLIEANCDFVVRSVIHKKSVPSHLRKQYSYVMDMHKNSSLLLPNQVVNYVKVLKVRGMAGLRD